MAIHKITPRSLDKSSSKRLVASTSFVDAINAVTNDSSDGGDGVIKAARGNTQLFFHYIDDAIFSGDHKVIGSVVDNKLKLIYFFVKHSNINHNGVWVYDPNGVLSLHTKYAKTLSGGNNNLSSVVDDQKNTIKCVAKGSYFNFDEHSVIQGNVVYGNSLNVPTGVARAVRGESGATISVTDSEKSTYEKDFHLYFTDNKGEPRKINVIPSMFSRAIASKQGVENPNGIFTSDEGGNFMLPSTEKEIILFSHACKPTPLTKPHFVFIQDLSSDVNNFEKSEGFKFAYRIVYSDGSLSSISPKSGIAIPTSIIFQGAEKNPDHSPYNVCRVFIESDIINDSWSYIKRIQVLGQQGDGPYKIIEEIDALTTSVDNIYFDFKNDVIGIPVASKDENKFFDSVPQKAEAQSVVDNRLMYGNYVEGLPNHKVEATLSVEYDKSTSLPLSQSLLVEPTVCLESHGGSNEAGNVSQKTSGFRITIGNDSFPLLDVGDKITLGVSFKPRRNFHLYNAIDSFHQSRHLGVENNDEGNLYWQTPDEAGALNIFPNATTSTVALNDTSYAESFNAMKDNGGVASVFWKTVDSIDALPSVEEMYLGTSAAHPFVIPGNVLSFSITLECIQSSIDSNTLRSAFFDVVDRVLGNRDIATAWELDNTGNDYFSIYDLKRYSTFDWDLPIENFQTVQEGDDLSKLISMLSRNLYGSPNLNRAGGAVIPKKGSAKFGLMTATPEESADDPDFQEAFNIDKSREYKIFLESIPNDGLEFWTCVRKWIPGSPWWLLSPDFMSNVANGSATLSNFYDQSNFTNPQYIQEIINPFTGAPVTPAQVAIDAGGEEAYIITLYNQQNSILDFQYPVGGYLDLGPNISGDWLHLNESSKTIMGYVYDKGGIPLGNSTDYFFISCHVPEELISVATASIIDDYAKFFSLFDGDGGPGGSLPPDRLPTDYIYNDVYLNQNPIYKALNFASSAFGGGFMTLGGAAVFYGPWFTGKILSTCSWLGVLGGDDLKHIMPSLNSANVGNATQYDRFSGRTTVPLIQGNSGGILSVENNISHVVKKESIYSTPNDADGLAWVEYPHLTMSFRLKNPQIEIYSSPTIQITSSSGILIGEESSQRSFKSNSDHDFGVVFYDSHGRRSFVNPIGSVFVRGYSDQERGNLKGKASVLVEMNGNPPSWADSYQIVYGGNKTITNFIQYTTNAAFSIPTSGETNDDGGKIYVSLNFLQSSEISYSKEFGARGEDQSLSIYKFSEGDKLRIISYQTAYGRTFPRNYVFEVIETVYFDELSPDSNPLISDVSDPSAKYFGEFVVIKNNDSNSNFDYTSVAQGISYWDQNVVFEIFSPKKETGIETQVYQEVGEVYKTIKVQYGNNLYQPTPILINEGDVYFRPFACNLNKYEGSQFLEIIGDVTDTDGSAVLNSNFNTLYLESHNASDLFPSKIKNYGRYNVASLNAKRLRREAGIIYSERSSVDSDIFNYSSFNSSLFPYKDIEERFGNINFMDEIGGNLFVIQQDRCTMIPVSSTILSNALGEDQLIASNEILGKERVYSIKAGCDNNPESVVRIDNTFYFAHKSSGRVFRFVDGQGIEDISDVGMSAYFKALFSGAIAQSNRPDAYDVRIVGGYDPVCQEYMLTVLSPKDLDISSSGPDNQTIFGCTDPASINYNPAANADDGSCIYEDGPIGNIVVEGYNGGVISFDNLPYGTTYTDDSITIKNIGDGPVSVINYFIINDPAGVFNINTPPSPIEPGQSFQFTITAFKNSPWISSGSIAVINFSNNDGYTSFSVPLSASFVEEEEDDVQVIGDFFFNTKYYLGGTEITQTFADNVSPLWKLQVDEDKKLQYVSNTLSGPGKSALVEVEISLNSEAYSQVGLFPFAQGQKLVISGSIDANQVGGLTYQPIQTSANIPSNSYSVSIEDNRIFELEIYHNGLPTPSNPTVRIGVCNIIYPKESIGQIYDFGDIVLEPNVPTIVGQLGEISLYGQSYVEYVDYKNSDNREVTALEQLELIQSEVNGFPICLLDFDGDGIVSYIDVYNTYFNNPNLYDDEGNSVFDLVGDIKNDITIDDYETALQYVGFICPVQPNTGDGGEDEPGDEPGEVDNTIT